MPTADGDDRGDDLAAGRQTGAAGTVQDAFEAAPSPTAALEGPEHTVVAANAAFRAFARRSHPIGTPAQQVLPAFPTQQIADLMDLVYAAGEPFTAREWPTEDDRYLDFTLSPWRGADGGMRGILLTLADVTDQVQRASAQQSSRPAPLRPHETGAVQEALLPSGLPVLPRAWIAARYLPTAVSDAAGGDWFDAFALPDGRVALMVGDVAGDGVAAATAMGRLRAVLRQALTLRPDLVAVLADANRFAADDAALHAATVCVALLEPTGGRFWYATCGHPSPLVAAADGTARHLPGTGSAPLGTGAALAAIPGSAVLALGEVLLLYSDGLVARPGRTLDAGLADLEIVAGDTAANPELAAWPAGTPAERVSHLTVELLARGGYVDDVTTVAVWRQPAPHPRLDLDVPASQEAVPTLRLALDDWLDALAIARGDRQLAELSVTEVVTNAVEHAYPPGRPGSVRLEASIGTDGYLETRVSDRGRWRRPDITDTERGQGLSVALQFGEHLQVSHPPQEAGQPPGVRGTVVTMRHRLHRRAMLAPLAAGPAPAAPAGHASFAAELVTNGPRPRIRVSGPVDITTADRLASRLLAASRAGVLPLTVDLSAVSILASAGVAVLYRLRAQLTAHGQDLTLVSEPGSPAAAVLDLVRLPRRPR